MNKKTIIYVFGTRPELIKMIPLILESQKNSHIRTVVCSTGQHRDMLQSLYQFFGIKPDIDFELMKPNQNLVSLHADTMNCMKKVIEDYSPEWVVVQGDTTSAHAAAMAAFYMKVKVAHVEAGLRTYDIHSPFPEEMNRRAIGLIARAHLCPTEDAARNLRQEKTDSSSSIEITGNTGIDTLHIVARKFETEPQLAAEYRQKFSYLNMDRYVLTTMHRRENFGEPLQNMLNALLAVAREHQIDILFPVHPNPNVRQAVDHILQPEKNQDVVWLTNGVSVAQDKTRGRIFLIEPLDYPALIFMMKNSHFVMTDSGGIQEEAPTFKKKILVLRTSTERPEGIAAGFSDLVGTDGKKIKAAADHLMSKQSPSDGLQTTPNPFGDGQASIRIIQSLLNH